MAQTLHIAVGNKLYSSWSLRAWLLLKAFGIPFEETVIAMYRDDTKARMLAFSPTGKVPAIRHDGITVWESLAIMEYVAEAFPDKAIWPAGTAARAHARAASSEMHAGFQALRSACPMNLTRMFKPKAYDEAVLRDVARIEALWAEARSRFGAGGPFLYGAFSAADAMYAPVVMRLHHYQLDVSTATRAYMDAIIKHPAFEAWRADAHREPWRLPHYEEGHETQTVLVQPVASA